MDHEKLEVLVPYWYSVLFKLVLCLEAFFEIAKNKYLEGLALEYNSIAQQGHERSEVFLKCLIFIYRCGALFTHEQDSN